MTQVYRAARVPLAVLCCVAAAVSVGATESTVTLVGVKAVCEWERQLRGVPSNVGRLLQHAGVDVSSERLSARESQLHANALSAIEAAETALFDADVFMEMVRGNEHLGAEVREGAKTCQGAADKVAWHTLQEAAKTLRAKVPGFTAMRMSGGVKRVITSMKTFETQVGEGALVGSMRAAWATCSLLLLAVARHAPAE
ncbi:putative Glutamic acid alanine rich protein of Trypanosoma [Trypanosoma vivax]|nr:putative Glutamic acid alanine rich protein of Trypanosoma [Trypanosoma vivax]KAH8607908.1 putative Glutamic acid alanine rich protein of Trypanosoma [Trypanosoma vivax]KAH8608100.1 putative Glutamic acid alanine rich protein of Trypanosoma [Trypanosoma vivax]KAH8608137.1 putative Glutamic acid alanine rich protein of Trypanosoma [Trypanosoma vivax]KAH8608210.1 putative Glutamic acid alanine rich protein of Trypanosoma [Trypanosoma vivax]